METKSGVIELADSTGTRFVTIGHPTRSIQEFIEILKADGITTLVDIRTIS